MNAISDATGLRPATVHTLPRTGRRPVRFEGWQLVETTGAPAGRHLWHDLNIYRTVTDEVVVELVVRGAAPDRPDVSRVETFPGLAEAASWLEAHRAADDLPLPEDLGARDTALPWAVLGAVQLRQSIERIELDYRALLSDVFVALDLTEAVERRAVSGGMAESA